MLLKVTSRARRTDTGVTIGCCVAWIDPINLPDTITGLSNRLIYLKLRDIIKYNVTIEYTITPEQNMIQPEQTDEKGDTNE